jgi:hypothetical protein
MVSKRRAATFWQPHITHRMSKRVYRALTEVKGLKDRMVWGGGGVGCGVVRLAGGKETRSAEDLTMLNSHKYCVGGEEWEKRENLVTQRDGSRQGGVACGRAPTASEAQLMPATPAFDDCPNRISRDATGITRRPHL